MILTALCLAACVVTSAQSPAQVVVAPTPVTWLIFVDDLHLDFRNTGHIRNAIKKISAELIQEGDTFAIASSGPSGLAVDAGKDRQLLDAAIKKTTGNALRFEDLIGSPSGAVEARYRVSIALTAAQSMIETGSRASDGPTALVFISNGYSVDIREQLTQLSATAASAMVRIFAIDPRVAFNDLNDLDRLNPAWPAHRDAMRGVLQSIADGSGGLAIVDGDFVSQLKRIAATMREP